MNNKIIMVILILSIVFIAGCIKEASQSDVGQINFEITDINYPCFLPEKDKCIRGNLSVYTLRNDLYLYIHYLDNGYRKINTAISIAYAGENIIDLQPLPIDYPIEKITFIVCWSTGDWLYYNKADQKFYNSPFPTASERPIEIPCRNVTFSKPQLKSTT